jgi:predicted flavoprotein YhiN
MHEIINTDVLIIGGGASGLAAAITLKQINPQLNVTIAERLSRTGKKILATGNGRCNLGNINISNEYYHGSVKNYMEIIESTQEYKLKTIYNGKQKKSLTINKNSILTIICED